MTDLSSEIVSRLVAVETASNGLSNRIALVEQEGKHTREMFEARMDSLGAQFRTFDTSLLAFDVKLDKISNLLTATTTDTTASVVGKELSRENGDLRRDLTALQNQVDKITTQVIGWGSILSLFKWVGFPSIILCFAGIIFIFGKVNHLW